MKKFVMLVLVCTMFLGGCSGGDTGPGTAPGTEELTYRNAQYGCSISFPADWEGKYYVKEVESNWIDICHQNGLGDSRVARFFTLHLFNNEEEFEARNASFSGAITLRKIFEDEGLIAAVTFPTDVAYVHSEKEYFEEYQEMGEDIEQVLQRFKQD